MKIRGFRREIILKIVIISIFQPGVYRKLIKDILKILQTEFDLKLKTGKPERFGNATIKSICNFQMKVGDKEKTLQFTMHWMLKLQETQEHQARNSLNFV